MSEEIVSVVVPWAMAIIGWLLGLGAGALYAWNNAPMVGGEFWPYIRVVVVILAGLLTAKVAALVGLLLGAGISIVLILIAAVVE